MLKYFRNCLMGPHLLDSYCGAQIFEIYGLGQEVVDLAFCGSVSKIGGLTLNEVIHNYAYSREFFNTFLFGFDILVDLVHHLSRRVFK